MAVAVCKMPRSGDGLKSRQQKTLNTSIITMFITKKKFYVMI